MAKLYTSELRTLFPRGPYRLGGHCIGGLIAIEMARLLRAQGERVEGALVITDAPNLAASTHRPTMPQAGTVEQQEIETMKEALLSELAQCAPIAEAPWSDAERSVTQQRFVRMVGRLCRVVGYPFNRWTFEPAMDRWIVRFCAMTGMRVPRPLRGLYCGSVMVRAARRFRPAPYHGDMLFFRTNAYLGAQMGLPGWWSDVCFGFKELCVGKFSVTFINSSHNGVVRHPRTAEIVRSAFGVDH
jgi:hypothetical protein